MKKVFIVILLSLTMGLFAQKPTVKKVEVYGVSWDSRFRTPTTIKTVKKRSYYRLVLNNNFVSNFDDLFYDYKDCKKILMSQDTIPFRHYPPSYKDKDCIVCVKLHFSIRTITLYFRDNGEYYFQGRYYKTNKELYFFIFSFFAKDAIMPNELIREGEIIHYQKRGLQIPE